MFDLLIKKISEKLTLTEDEENVCINFFTPKKLRKKQYLLQQGDACKYTAFVSKGVLRSYNIDEKGNEHIVQFAPEGWWITDMYSFLTAEPSHLNIDALEDAEVLLINKTNYELMLQKVPKLERYFRILIQNSMIAMQRRLIGNLSLTAEEKYMNLIKSYPDHLQRVPQHMIASFLGITPETLSRVRKKIAQRSKID